MRRRTIFLIAVATLLAVGAGFAAETMTRLQASFVSGLLSPRMLGRVDLEKYGSGCSDLTNFVVTPHGAIERRPGFRYVAETKTSAKKARLVPFQYSITQAYVIDFGHQYILFYAD